VCAPLPAARPDPRHARPAPERTLLYALVQAYRAHLTRFHGIFAANAKSRAQLMPSGRGKRPATDAAAAEVRAIDEPRSHQQEHCAMNWRNVSIGSFPSTSPPASTVAVRYGSSPASRNPPPCAILAHFQKHGALERAHYRPAARALAAAAA
jgi:hypothetical protein